MVIPALRKLTRTYVPPAAVADSGHLQCGVENSPLFISSNVQLARGSTHRGYKWLQSRWRTVLYSTSCNRGVVGDETRLVTEWPKYNRL